MWTTKPTGTGFGLALAREIINEHAGEIRVDESQVSGATFSITLPISRAQHAVDVKEKVVSHVA
jgi:nitrogen-specific signal transduction histidine kinase